MKEKWIITGGAGLVGQNLVADITAEQTSAELVVIDKNRHNLDVLSRLHPDVSVICADLAEPGDWADAFDGATGVVILNAQIGAVTGEPFQRNTIDATVNVIDAIDTRCASARIVHVSSSVVNSVVDDLYVRSKTEQENLVRQRLPQAVVLRPTLMFGWFDRKHLGWLSRFMRRVPVFPIPGSGRYIRQPLYAGDFSRIIFSCLRNTGIEGAYNISGRQKIDYIDMIREIKRVTGAKAMIIRIPYRLFWVLLWVYALFDRNPPFTTSQLEALIAPDEFEVIDWPAIFNVTETTFETALDRTFNDSTYSNEVLQF